MFLNVAKCKSAIVGRNNSLFNEVVREIKWNGSATPLPVVDDVAKDAERIVHEKVKHFDQLDVLINSARIGMCDCVVNTKKLNRKKMIVTNRHLLMNWL